MTITSPAATPTLAHVVASGDHYATRGDRCTRCHRAVIACDVIITSPVAHVACLPARQRSYICTAEADQCWYADSRTLASCPLPASAHNLCASHHAQLCCDLKKPRRM